MAGYVGKIPTPKPIDEVFSYLADFANVEEWDPSCVSASPIDGGTPARGSRYAVTSRFLGSETELTYVIERLERPSVVVLRGENDAVVSIDTISFREIPGGGTEVTYEADLTLKGARRILDPVFGIAFRRLCAHARDRMEEVLAR